MTRLPSRVNSEARHLRCRGCRRRHRGAEVHPPLPLRRRRHPGATRCRRRRRYHRLRRLRPGRGRSGQCTQPGLSLRRRYLSSRTHLPLPSRHRPGTNCCCTGLWSHALLGGTRLRLLQPSVGSRLPHLLTTTSDQVIVRGKPGEPGHRNIGRGSCRSALGCRGME